MEGVIAKDIEDWDDFDTTVDELIDQRDQMPFKFLGFDTVDVMYSMACDFVVQKQKIKDGENYSVVGDIPYGRGYELATDLIQKTVSRLIKSGYGIFYVTHDSDKKITNRSGLEYDKTTVSLAKRVKDLIVNMSDFIIFIDNVQEKGSDKKLHDTRYIYFRAEGSDLEAGSRFPNITPRIPYDVDLFLETFEEAVLNSFKEEVDINKLKEEEQETRNSKAEAFTEKQRNANPQNLDSADALIAHLKEEGGSLSAVQRTKFKKFVRSVNDNKVDFSTITDIDTLKQIAAHIAELKG